MTKYLFFDTETNGLPKDFKAQMHDLDNWPRLIQIAWMLYENDVLLHEKEYIIRPEGFQIPESAIAIHGITQEQALQEGVHIEDVFANFMQDVALADYIVGHNFEFDLNVIGSEMLRNMVKYFRSLSKICTMKSSTDYCKLPGTWKGYKWPKLHELHLTLFGEEFEGAHDALADIRATSRCFFELINLNVISP